METITNSNSHGLDQFTSYALVNYTPATVSLPTPALTAIINTTIGTSGLTPN
jgi:hypothetical protein